MNFYRKYRPNSLEEIVGQDLSVNIIKNFLVNKDVPQSMILTGIHGVGKTTIARIISKNVNCTNSDGDLSCEKCSSCTSIQDGNSLDVLELDGASNNGVDEIRSIKDMANYNPSSSAKKVYIIDEFHMLSNSAFNALLKILEEPPKNVIFILATTNIKKVPETVLSRCIVLDLKSIKEKDIKELLTKVCKKEKINYTSESIDLISKNSNNSLRDALTLLEKLSLFGSNLSDSEISNILGLPSNEDINKIINHIVGGKKSDFAKYTSNLFDEKSLNTFGLIKNISNELLDKKIDYAENWNYNIDINSLVLELEDISKISINNSLMFKIFVSKVIDVMSKCRKKDQFTSTVSDANNGKIHNGNKINEEYKEEKPTNYTKENIIKSGDKELTEKNLQVKHAVLTTDSDHLNDVSALEDTEAKKSVINEKMSSLELEVETIVMNPDDTHLMNEFNDSFSVRKEYPELPEKETTSIFEDDKESGSSINISDKMLSKRDLKKEIEQGELEFYNSAKKAESTDNENLNNTNNKKLPMQEIDKKQQLNKEITNDKNLEKIVVNENIIKSFENEIEKEISNDKSTTSEISNRNRYTEEKFQTSEMNTVEISKKSYSEIDGINSDEIKQIDKTQEIAFKYHYNEIARLALDNKKDKLILVRDNWDEILIKINSSKEYGKYKYFSVESNPLSVSSNNIILVKLKNEEMYEKILRDSFLKSFNLLIEESFGSEYRVYPVTRKEIISLNNDFSKKGNVFDIIDLPNKTPIIDDLNKEKIVGSVERDLDYINSIFGESNESK